MLGLLSIISSFCDKLNKLNSTWAQMSDSIYHMTLKLLYNRVLGRENAKFFFATCNICDIVTYIITQSYYICEPLVVY